MSIPLLYERSLLFSKNLRVPFVFNNGKAWCKKSAELDGRKISMPEFHRETPRVRRYLDAYALAYRKGTELSDIVELGMVLNSRNNLASEDPAKIMMWCREAFKFTDLHPYVFSLYMQIKFLKIMPLKTDNGTVARLMSSIILRRYGNSLRMFNGTKDEHDRFLSLAFEGHPEAFYERYI